MDTNSNPNSEIKEIPQNDSTAEFAEVVRESQAEIQAAVQAPPKIGRKRGPYKKRERPQGAGAAPGSSPSVAQGPSVAPQAPPDISKHLIAPLVLISTVPARNTGIPELALTQDEAHACAVSLNGILDAYAPQGQLNPKVASILSAAVVFGSVFITKYQIYLEKTSERIQTENREFETPSPDQPFTSEQVDPFRRKSIIQGQQIDRPL